MTDFVEAGGGFFEVDTHEACCSDRLKTMAAQFEALSKKIEAEYRLCHPDWRPMTPREQARHEMIGVAVPFEEARAYTKEHPGAPWREVQEWWINQLPDVPR